MTRYIIWYRKCVVDNGETAPSDVAHTPSVPYVTFDQRRSHEFVRRGTDTRLRITDKLHVGGSVFTHVSRFGSKYY